MPVWYRLQQLFDEWKAIDYSEPSWEEMQEELRAGWGRRMRRLYGDDWLDADPPAPPAPPEPPEPSAEG